MAGGMNLRKRALQSRDAIELLSDKWRITILHVLVPGSLRTGELQRAISDVSPKVLTQTLRGMERDGLLTRTVFPVVPPRVQYQLTEMGESLVKPLRELCHWAEAHVSDRDRARALFDRKERAVPKKS
ncbi:MAG TPA: helix-turn-helix domain-containing protein [Candidatus Acidoferrum sp.]|nr:helix-turn-helix domain-containing protein [Candidatus Acidoferrum sp.]